MVPVRRQEKDFGLPRVGGKEKEAGRTQDFYGSETTLYDTVMADTCHYIFFKP